MTRKQGILAAALATICFFAGAVPAHAFDHGDKCQRRVEKAERNLDKATRRHGPNSPQADRRRHQLEEARERCQRHDHDHQ